MRAVLSGRRWRAACASFVLCLFCVGAVSAQGAQDGLALAKAKTCLGCHQVDAKRVGPAFSAIAQRYAGQERRAGQRRAVGRGCDRRTRPRISCSRCVLAASCLVLVQ